MFNRKAYTLLTLFICFILSEVYAQDQKIADSLVHTLGEKTLSDTAKLNLLSRLSFNEMRDLKKGLQYAEELISLSEQTGNKKYLGIGYFLEGTKKRSLGNLAEALEAYIKSAVIARETHQSAAEGKRYIAIADIYSLGNNHTNSKDYYNKAIRILRQSNDSISLASALLNAGDEFLKTNKVDSALLFFEESKVIFDKVNYLSGKCYSRGGIGMAYARIGKNNLAEKTMNEAIRLLEEKQDYYPICVYLTSMADVYLNKGDNQAALNYILRSLRLAEQFGLKEQVADASLKLTEFYEKAGNLPKAFTYYKKHITYRDSVNNIQSVLNMADQRTNFEVSQKQAEVNLLNQEKRNQKNLVVSLVFILGLTIIIVGILLRNNQHKQKAYRILNLQKQATDEQRIKAENALDKLQATQKQLIHSAKMASLGEVTAGIAHELQNPLNFVNNFSEVSIELLGELKEGTLLKLSASEKAEANEIVNDLVNNLKKISDHGKRADSIVKGMLQHSRGSTGKKVPTDINALADECLRLSYHGFRAKDKEFEVNLTSSFDKSIGIMEVIPQDIASVLLNLFNNAFYEVNIKKKQGNNAFEPHVSVTTKRVGNKVKLTIKDNGNGIPQKVVDKIFQPFFTTKPSGQGTGLGLSLSYDVIKAHGGELNAETQEGEGSEFSFVLPGDN